MSRFGHGAQVVNVTTDHKYVLDVAKLEQILMSDQIKDLPVVLVSVAGAYRGGKSFLLNLFLRYFSSLPEAREDGSWLGDDSEPLRGFSWCGGSKKNTSGILMWSEPFIAKLPSRDKVAVLLMDTQGTFDSTSTVRDCSTIFALSTLLSSVQIYNLSQNIQEDHLQYLQLFTEYGRLVKDQTIEKPFQILKFLVRDWPYPWEYPFGVEGGNTLLNERLKNNPDTPEELQEIRRHIYSSFDEISGFLMPHPGFEVLKPDFRGEIRVIGNSTTSVLCQLALRVPADTIRTGCPPYCEALSSSASAALKIFTKFDISPDFRNHLIQLVSSMFTPERLQPKLINGAKVKAHELFKYFKTYMELFNSDKLPTPTSIMKATAEIALQGALRHGLAQYEENMERDCGEKSPCVPAIDVTELHEEQKSLALTIFDSKMMMGPKAEIERNFQKLSNDIDSRLEHFTTLNMVKQQKLIEAAKNAYDEEIDVIKNGDQLCVHPMDLEVAHNAAMATATEMFNSSHKRFTDKIDIEKDKLIMNLESKHGLLKLNNDTNNRRAITELGMEYWRHMESMTSTDNAVNREELQMAHDQGLAQALSEFQVRRSRHNSYEEDIYRDELIELITNRYNQIKEISGRTTEREIRRAVTAYNHHMASAWNQRNQTLHPDDLVEENDKAMRQALLSFRPTRRPAAGFDTNDEDERNLKNILTDQYQQLKRVNESANRASIESATKVYRDTLDERESPSLSWFLVVPMVATAVQTLTLTHHEASKLDAKKEFYKKRRNKGNESTDIYLNELMTHLDDINNCRRMRKQLGEFVAGNVN